jgi:Zn-dependent protease with chaperone function
MIVFDANFNAAHGKIGLRRRPVLWLGMPLWEVLSDEQRVALLGHEFGHQVNGDLAYGLVVGTALRTLSDWYRLLQPSFRWKRTLSLFDLGELIGSAAAVGFLRTIGFGVGLLFRSQLALVLRSSQQAEYYADSLGATIGSRDAAMACMDTLHLAGPCVLAVQYAAKRHIQDVWVAERHFVTELPAKEWERFRRIDAARGTSIDTSHPPTTLRVELLRLSPVLSPRIELSAYESLAIAGELEGARQVIAGRIRDRATG